MLVLTVKPGGKVIVGTKGADGALVEKLEITLLQMRGRQVKLGFTADPGELRIHRSEIWKRIRDQREQAKAAQGMLPGIEAA